MDRTLEPVLDSSSLRAAGKFLGASAGDFSQQRENNLQASTYLVSNKVMAFQIGPRLWTKCRNIRVSSGGAYQALYSTQSNRSSTAKYKPLRASTAKANPNTFWGINGRLGEVRHSVHVDEKTRVMVSELGPLSNEDQEVDMRLKLPASNPARILRDCISGGTASVHVVRLCINSHFKEVAQAPRAKQRKTAEAQDRIASVALSHLLSDVNKWARFTSCCPDASFALCYYALVEGLGNDIFFEWISTDVPPRYARSSAWRGIILRDLVAAHFAYDSGHNKDKTIECFLDAYSLQERARLNYKEQLAQDKTTYKPPIHYLSLFPAWVELTGVLAQGFSRDTNPRLYKRLLEVASLPGVHKGTQSEIEFDTASLLLHFPGRPQETAAVQILRNFAAGDAGALPERMTTPKGQRFFKQFLQRTVDVLSSNGNVEDRDWVKQKYDVLLDPTTGNFATPTRVERPESAPGRPRRGSSAANDSKESVPFPTFT